MILHPSRAFTQKKIKNTQSHKIKGDLDIPKVPIIKQLQPIDTNTDGN